VSYTCLLPEDAGGQHKHSRRRPQVLPTSGKNFKLNGEDSSDICGRHHALRSSVSAYMVAVVLSVLHIHFVLRCCPITPPLSAPEPGQALLQRGVSVGGQCLGEFDWAKQRHARCGRCRCRDWYTLVCCQEWLHVVPRQHRLRHG
jgi:hypothetical protein